MLDSVRNRQAMLRAWASHDVDVYHAFAKTISQLTGKPLTGLRILDMGCGSNAPLTVLLHAAGCHVTGMDANIGFRWGLGFKISRYTDYRRQAGLTATARKAAGELVFDRVYYRTLAEKSGLTLTEKGLDLQVFDVQQPNLPSDTFDIVHSNATWEHISDVRAANRTIARALKPGGVAYIEIHLFPSLSGGHDLPWIVPGKTELGDVKPWRHLRDASWQAPVFLNRMRERDYRAAFEDTPGFEIVDWKTEYTEGREYVTPDVLRDLPDFNIDELTKRSIVVVARKTGSA